MTGLINDARDFYCEASSADYVINMPSQTIEALPGSRVIIYERGDWRCFHCYFNEESRSFGFKIIWLRGRPFWIMSYGGECLDKARVMPMLEATLQGTYVNRVFIGGRGPGLRIANGLEYRNNLKPPSSFEKSSGREEIKDIETGQLLFWQEFASHLLIEEE